MPAHIIGAYSTVFGKLTDRTHQDIAREVFDGVLADAGLPDGQSVDALWFSNFGLHQYGQGGIRAQVCFTPMIRDGSFPVHIPVMNVENGCASGSSALYGAVRDVLAGGVHLALVVGLEKLHHTDPAVNRFKVLESGIDQLDRDVWETYFMQAAQRAGKPFELAPERSMFMDTYGIQAAYHMKKYGTTQRQYAIAAAKTHNYGADNPRAQYRFRMTPEEVLADREVSYPLTRSMCSPIGDGGAALLLASDDFLRNCAPAVRDRAVTVRACAMSSGQYRDLDTPSMTSQAAKRAYAQAGLSPFDIDLAEVHDASSFSEIFQAEMMGFCAEGEGGRLAESGATGPGGRIPINTSGGLISKGHPIGATGISMLSELVVQLRHEAGSRQVANARLGLTENGGGIMGFDEATCVVTILERS